MVNIWAKSGYWADIQNAANQAQPGDNILLPAGTFNFVNVGESWTGARVVIPARVNLFGAPTERDGNGQVIEWKTILRLPWEVPSFAPNPPIIWFGVDGNEDPNKPFRFSDIKLVGWRYENQSSKAWYIGLQILRVLNFRADHCHFQDLAQSAISIGASSAYYNRATFKGVVDHCRLVNTYGDPGFPVYETRSLGYGIGIRRWACDVWDYNLANVIGKYTNYTIFVEDNYFSKWRHCVASNDGVHYVFRRNIVENAYGIGEADGHGSYADPYHPYAVGTRAMEVYNNTFKNPDTTWYAYPWAINIRGGSVLAFNNTLIGYYALCDLNNDAGNYDPYCPQCHINQTYIWNNILGGATLIKYNSDNIENTHYFLRAPTQAQDGFTYTPYVYPHPLASGQPQYQTPFLGELEEGVYKVTVPLSIVSGSDTYNFKQWEDGSTNPVRTINLTSDMAITATYEPLAPPPPGYHHLTIVAYNGTTTPTAGIYEIAEGTTVQVTATPNTGYRFKHWLLDNVIAGLDPTITVAMDADHTLLAVCEPTPKFPVLQAGLGLLGVVGLVYLATRKG